MIEHGGTDAGPRPSVDASTNANPYGPSPVARTALRADVGPYPDPTGTSTVQRLATHHDVDVDTVVLGAGATELIDRLVRVVGGPVGTTRVTFGEYAGAAARHGVAVTTVDETDLPDALDGVALAFVCSPGNPDGAVRDAAWGEALAARAAATGTVLVWDLAYAPMVDVPVPVPDGAVALHAPNKAHGCTGLRAGWLSAPVPLAQRLRAAAVTWHVSVPGLSFLAGTATRAADAWVAARCATLRADRDLLAMRLRDAGLLVRTAAAPFLLVAVGAGDGDARTAAARCRTDHGVAVRPTDSLGLPGWLRVATPRTEQVGLVADALLATLTTTDDTCTTDVGRTP